MFWFLKKKSGIEILLKIILKKWGTILKKDFESILQLGILTSFLFLSKIKYFFLDNVIVFFFYHFVVFRGGNKKKYLSFFS